MPTFDEYLASTRTLIEAMDDGLDLPPEEWANLWNKATPYQKRVARLRADPTLAPHGVPSTYTNWGCRCPDCSAAYSESRRTKRTERDFAEEPVLAEDEVPEQIKRLQGLVAQGITPTAKGQALLDEWEASQVL